MDRSAGSRLRQLMSEGPVLLPGVFNALSAKAAWTTGAQALYLAGSATTNTLLAMPDIALITQTEMAQQAAYACSATPLPTIADADTGYGDVHNVQRTIREMERAGLAGVHLEDQESPKRCGHLDGKQLVSPQQMEAKVRAAVEAKQCADFLLIARTDARGVEGMDAAIDRAKRYVAAGADAVFPEGLGSEQEFGHFRAALPDVPLLANMTEFGKTPLIPFSRFAELGYNLVIYPNAAFRVVLKAMMDTYTELLATGTQAGMIEKMWTRKQLYDLVDYSGFEARDRKWSESET